MLEIARINCENCGCGADSIVCRSNSYDKRSPTMINHLPQPILLESKFFQGKVSNSDVKALCCLSMSERVG
jgi:hypothetical protein